MTDSHTCIFPVLFPCLLHRVREQLMHRSPEKKMEGLFAGLSKWSKDKADSRSSPGNGAAGGKGSQVSQARSLLSAFVASTNRYRYRYRYLAARSRRSEESCIVSCDTTSRST